MGTGCLLCIRQLPGTIYLSVLESSIRLNGRIDLYIIIGSLVLLHVTAVLFILLQKLLYHISKQCRPLSDIFYSPSALCLRLICTVCQISLYGC